MTPQPDIEKMIGQSTNALTTPALVIDADAMVANLGMMAEYFVGAPWTIQVTLLS